MTALPTSLTLGSLRVDTPVVLAPMAGITNAAYRRLCAEQGAGLYVCEMITSRGLVEGDETTLKMLVFDELETVRSVQLYGTDPVYIGKAVEILCADYGVAHVDLNFGCPVPKVTRKGGGGALPWKRGLLGEILTAAVAAAAPYDVPVTMKTRKGLDDDHLTYLDAGRIAQEAGVRRDRAARPHRAAGLLRRGRLGRHRRARRARRHPGARQRRHLGGGRRAADGRADRRRRRGRRPRLPGPAVAVPRPGRRVRRRGRRHPADPRRGPRDDAPARRAAVRAHGGGARLQGVPQARRRGTSRASRAGGELRRRLALVDSLAALDELLADLDPAEPFPVARARHARGVARARPARRWCCPRGGSTTPTAAVRTCARTPTETTGG